MDIKVSVGTVTKKKAVIVDNSKTPKDALNQAEVDYSTTTTFLDGAPLTAPEMNKSFADLGINTDCMLVTNAKTSNA